jgi:hypothetical protein
METVAMTIRAGINGFGRVGRLGFRAAWGNPAFDIVHVNEIAGDAVCMAHLLEFDSVHGRWQRSIAAGTKAFSVDGKPIGYSMHKTPGEVDWAGMSIELVIECSSKFKTAQALQPYFDHGVKMVLVSAPVPEPVINRLSAARFFLFGSRDVWFVVGLPVFLYSVLGWSFVQVGGFLALWVIGYGIVQANAPRLLRRSHHGRGPGGGTALLWAFVLAAFPAAIALGLQYGFDPALVLVAGLVLFGVVFALNSAVHSYLILAYADFDKVSMNVGFYYMANAGGRLAGTVLSGWVYQTQGLSG